MVNRLLSVALVLLAFFPAACATRVGPDGQSEVRFDPRFLAKTDIDRVIDADRAEILAGMKRIAEKLYKRNPREWKKAGLSSREAAVKRLFAGSLDFAELDGRREGAAALLRSVPTIKATGCWR